MTGPSRKPDSSTQVVPVISPFPFCANHPAKTGFNMVSLPRGRMAVTPVRTGPWPTCSLPSPEISVVWPTVTPGTSVMALNGPGEPSKGMPRSRARGLAAASFSWATFDGAVNRDEQARKSESVERRMEHLRRKEDEMNECCRTRSGLKDLGQRVL